MPKQERDLFESRIKYASDFSFFNWLSRPENSHMRAAYTVGAGLNADLAVEPIGLVLYPIAQGAKALAAVSKFSDKLLTGGKVTKKVSKIKEAREIKKIKKDSEKARALATELEKKVETNVLVYGMDPFTAAALGLQAAQIGEPQTVDAPDPLEVTTDQLVSGSTVDQGRVDATIAKNQAASVKTELDTLMQDFQGGDPPSWAAGAMRNAAAAMAARGLSASSMAGMAIVQAGMEAALPIAQIDASNKQEMALRNAEQRASFLGMEFDQEFQAKVRNAARISEIANINFTADQQIA